MSCLFFLYFFFFFFNDTATTEIYTLSLHDALPIAGCCHNDSECNDHCTRCDPNTHLCSSNALIDPFGACKSCNVDTDCDVIGRCAGQACGPAGVCIAVTALNCDDRLPDFNGVCHLDGTGQPQCSYRCVTRPACDDGDLCTDDSCDTT